MIESFKTRDTERLFLDQRVKRWKSIQQVARRKLQMLHAARQLFDLAAVAGNNLHALSKDREGQYAIRINDQYRVCFEWHEGNAYNVEIADYL
jgi:proteic killer suppression protein